MPFTFLLLTLLVDFQAMQPGSVPDKGWETRGGSPDGVYSIRAEEKTHYLAARDTGRSVQLFKKGGWDLSKYRSIAWRWRVHMFPAGADEREAAKNDSAAAVYVVFPRRWFVPETIKYVWSRSVPAGTVIRRSDRFPVIVVRSGNERPGKWAEEQRNVADDYQKLFGRKAPDPVAVGFLTDANAVKGEAAADYGDIRLIQ